MTDTETLRPEVAQALGFMDRNQKYGDGSVCAGDINIIRAELLRLTDENARLRERVSDTEHFRDVHIRAAGIFRNRAEKAEAELAALKARIAGSSVVKIANYGDPFIVLPDHFTVPNSLKGKTVRLVVEE